MRLPPNILHVTSTNKRKTTNKYFWILHLHRIGYKISEKYEIVEIHQHNIVL